ncbi:MerR family transcriptional regulator [Kineosporia rhizophila]|uniref:MerR family transcriptional regulator n=1 Tax=Kineosporia rhizophila TaxID=84633 RepID=UPI001E2C5756|nr:MerR family transcriptional regulator [Kineosporia rhizophila]
MTATDPDVETWLSIADVSRLTGLSAPTLRWYEREGLLPRVRRGSDRRRRYSEAEAQLVVLLARLRATGMPTEEMRTFSILLAGGAPTHGRRLALLERHEARIRAQMAELEQGLEVLQGKAVHYRSLIASGLDCEGRLVDAAVAVEQRRSDV